MVALRRLPLFGLAAIGLLAGLAAGTARIGWEVPAIALDWALVHGPLMVCAFFGTVIGLERAVALDRAWGYAAPTLTGLGGLALIAGLPAAGLAFAFGSAVFAAMALLVALRQPALFTAVMAVGALAWLAATTLWLAGAAMTVVVPLWAAFLVLTIAGERIELTRFLKPSRDRAVTAPLPPLLLLAAPVLALAGADDLAGRVFGLGLVLLAAWLLRHDIARRTVRQDGLTRYMAVCLLSGYFWLGFSGLIALALGLPAGGPVYDAVLHTLFVGFVFAMVFGHAPVILPAVLKVALPYRPVFYAPLLLLHLSLLLRIAGDIHLIDGLRLWGGLLNVAAILTFLVTMASHAIVATRARGLPRR